MSEITKEDLARVYNPFDVVTNSLGSVGYISEVNINECQEVFKHQVSYAVEWLVVQQANHRDNRHAWFEHEELTVHNNLFSIIAKGACHPFGSGRRTVEMLEGRN